jgi:hypothetical protein
MSSRPPSGLSSANERCASLIEQLKTLNASLDGAVEGLDTSTRQSLILESRKLEFNLETSFEATQRIMHAVCPTYARWLLFGAFRR